MKFLTILAILVLLQACKHPLVIEGEGDIVNLVDASGTYGCTLEQFLAADPQCTGFDFTQDYIVNYEGQPRSGWRFSHWNGSCRPDSEAPFCRIEASLAWSNAMDGLSLGDSVPPLTAVFVEIDTDLDGTPDNSDAFPDDPAESRDTDEDGVGDNADAFPDDPTETADSDNDGVGDNADAFPLDDTESADSDGDGVGDNADPTPNGETGDGGGALACFNQEMIDVGTLIMASYSTVSSDGSIQFSYDQLISGGATFNGKSVLMASGDTIATGDAPSNSHTDQFLTLGDEPGSVRVYGLNVDAVASGITTSTATVFTPYLGSSFDLAVGESITFDWSQETTVSVFGFGSTITSDVSRTTTYVGRESVTVAAGTYDTCRFEVSEDDSTNVSATTEWFHVGSGMLIKQVSGDTTSEMVSASINGEDI